MDSLVSTEWLAAHADDAQVVVLDASAHLPAAGRDPHAEFRQGHIPGARFLDLPSWKNPNSPTPSAVPDPEQFAQRMRQLGVAEGDRIVLYDDSAVKTSARAWFILRMNGVENVAILDGGLAKWHAEGRPLEGGEPEIRPSDYPVPSARTQLVRNKADLLANLDTGAEQVIDARDAGRFTGSTVDNVHNLPGGHIPGARHLFFGDLYREDGTLRPEGELRKAFDRAKVNLGAPIVTSCGSGVTASVLLFALHRIGKEGALYDGSWAEWGADPDTPKATGADN